jgi:hypothetical protein
MASIACETDGRHRRLLVSSTVSVSHWSMRAKSGGALRYAAWLTFDQVERLLMDGLASQPMTRPQPLQHRGNCHSPPQEPQAPRAGSLTSCTT